MSKNVELALKKQRLQLRAAAQRVMILHALESAAPAFNAVEKIRSGWNSGWKWAKTHPAWLAGIAVALLVARPRSFSRWAKRGFLAWQTWRKLRGAVDLKPAPESRS
ncbi:MAG: YqjK-like family protein [Zoogloeaceae bacterium]|nr:YqjK-like family protein [Zoogloeaceae bacterium]